ncbi:MAG: HD domain-containing phosphohydrolase [Planctomycetota bacterium]
MDIQQSVISAISSLDKTSFEEALLNITENILTYLNADCCYFFVIEDDELIPDVYTFGLAGNHKLQHCELSKNSTDTMSAWVNQNGLMLILDDSKKDSRYGEELKLLGPIINNKPVIAAIPLICVGDLVGVVDIVLKNKNRIDDVKLLQIRPLLNVISFLYSRRHSESLAKLAEVCMHFLEGRDRYTYGHSLRVANYSLVIAEQLKLSNLQKRKLRLAALLHDLGKITFSDSLFVTEKPLTKLEMQLIKMHPIIGANIISEINKSVALIIRSHHEQYDGKGYPDYLTGKEIPFLAMILSVTDSLDAMLTERPYRSAMKLENAIEEISLNSGKQFDPQIVRILIECYKAGKLNIQ